MNDETRRILELLAQGKITVDEADRLLHALGDQTAPGAASDANARQAPRYVRIAVHHTRRDGTKERDVNIRVPIAVVKSGLRLGALIPDFANARVAPHLREKGIDVDFSKLDAAAIDAALQQIGDAAIEIESADAHVRITPE